MKNPELQAISVLSKDLSLNLTINQLSKTMGMSYGFTNKYINDFIDEGLLCKKVVGSAILCSLNFSNEKTLGLLILNSINEKIEFLKTKDQKELSKIDALRKLPNLKSLYLHNGVFCVVSGDKTQDLEYLNSNHLEGDGKKSNIILIDPNEFKLQLKKLDLHKTIIIDGYEQFWRMICEMKS